METRQLEFFYEIPLQGGEKRGGSRLASKEREKIFIFLYISLNLALSSKGEIKSSIRAIATNWRRILSKVENEIVKR